MGYVTAQRLSATGRSRKGGALCAETDGVAFRRGGRGDGGALRRFEAVAPHADREQAALPAASLPVIEARTVFPSTVVEAGAPGRVLVSGHNNPKLGRRVTRGIWAGMPIFHLTLEERATCPHECHVWRECYGNAMHQARRHRHGPALVRRLGADLCAIALEHPGGFVVRLHTLGDFYSVEYASRWAVWLGMHPELRVFGFTAHPAGGVIGGLLRDMNAQHPDRCAIRFSSADGAGAMGATTIWRQPEAPVVAEGIVCPAQTGAQDCCGTCGMCWARGARGKAIVFVGHGMRRRGPADERRGRAGGPPGGARAVEEARARATQIAKPLPTAERDAVAAPEEVFPTSVAQPWEAPVEGASSPARVTQTRAAVRFRTCQWPFGEPGTAAFRFCSADALDGKSYCGEHQALAFIPRGRGAA